MEAVNQPRRLLFITDALSLVRFVSICQKQSERYEDGRDDGRVRWSLRTDGVRLLRQQVTTVSMGSAEHAIDRVNTYELPNFEAQVVKFGRLVECFTDSETHVYRWWIHSASLLLLAVGLQ